ncbi:MAG: outer membrane beta-barrel protein [Gemmatimonadota bacterium]
MRLSLILAVVAATAASVHAQRPVTFSLAGGLSAPHSDLRGTADLGWHALGGLNVGSIMLPLGIRLEAAYNRFGIKDAAQASLGTGSHNVLSLTGNLTYRLPMTNSPLAPYLIGGLGAYRTTCDADISCGSSTEFGWNVGMGVRLYALGLRPFVEGRFHNSERGTANLHYFPVTLGLTF